MPTAAAPAYLGKTFKTASPALRFGMFLELWGVNNKTEELLWTTYDINYREAGRDKKEREFHDENKTHALKTARHITDVDKSTLAALASRQKNIANTLSKQNHLTILAQSIAPFTTGLGNEHPLENGFAFLNPYGLPYLPGSGVKGVVRRAAQELAEGEWGISDGWSNKADYTIKVGHDESVPLSMIDVLFGREPHPGDSHHVHGALSFWDVIPQIKGGQLSVEIMTPHQTHYYQEKEGKRPAPPHDSGSPNPISFLTVPPGSGFTFHVTCDRRHLERLAPALVQNDEWKEVLKAAFAHAFKWLGFGAKTAVGYGAMERDTQREQDEIKKQEEREAKERETREREAMSPVERTIQESLDQRTNQNEPKISSIIRAMKDGSWTGEEKIEVARWLETEMRREKRWKESSQKKKPSKDRPYQDTLQVQKWLAGG